MAIMKYAEILEKVKASGALNAPAVGPLIAPPAAQSVTVSGTTYTPLPPTPVLKFDAFQDREFGAEVASSAADPSVSERMGINKQKQNTFSPDADGGVAIINASRVMINAKEDFAMLFGNKGVAIASPEFVNFDAGKDITFFARDEVFIGIPNKGAEIKKITPGTSKGHPTLDRAYEPLVLGWKLANWLEDLLFMLKDSNSVSNVGEVGFQPSSQAEFALLAGRIPEIISTYGFIDGVSHEKVNDDELNALLLARSKAKDFVPPKGLAGTFEGTGVTNGGYPPPPPLNPITNPLATLPEFFVTPDNPPYGDSL
tara:strand:- start:3083 stop:4021 length:939 start_codon:yes stop_codon:yes gene_type:complete